MRCAYCGQRAIHQDHVVPKSYRRIRPIPDELSGTVPACGSCNWLKGQRRLVPPSWEDKLPALIEAYPGTTWRVWTGGLKEQAYRSVHT